MSIFGDSIRDSDDFGSYERLTKVEVKAIIAPDFWTRILFLFCKNMEIQISKEDNRQNINIDWNVKELK
jgi:hypothetical protein